MNTRTRSLLFMSLLCLCGAVIGYLAGWLLGIFAYAESYNAGQAIRLQAVGISLGSYLGLAETRATIGNRFRRRFVGTLLVLLIIVCTEGYFFGMGTHRVAVHKIYGAGGNLARNTKGDVIGVTLAGRPYHGFEGEDFLLLEAFPKLQRLWLYWPEVGETESEIIGSLITIKSLVLFGKSVDDRVLANLQGLIALEVLDLSNTRVTDAGVFPLVRMQQLRHLQLDNTNVSTDAIAYLREKLPNCNVVKNH